MDFDPSRPASTPREAATVVLLRPRAGDGAAEVFLLRRHRGASFMAQAFVFPGGARDGDEDPRETAARELFEEAGVLLADRPVSPGRLADLRKRQAGGEPLGALLAAEGVALALDRLQPFAHWITPSAEKKRFSARFFLAELPPGQTPSFDAKETVDELWATPADALARADELRLPPPQLRTLGELAAYEQAARALASSPGASSPLAGLFAAARARNLRPIVPRFAEVPGSASGFALLLPWDPEYETLGKGEGTAFPAERPLAGAPSRFFLEGAAWKHRAP